MDDATTTENAESELVKLRQKQAWQEYLAKETVSGWDAFKLKLGFGVLLALVFSLFTFFITIDINNSKLDYGILVLTLLIFLYAQHQHSEIKSKLSHFDYINDEDRILGSFYAKDDRAKEIFKHWSNEKILDKLKEFDKTNADTTSGAIIAGSGFSLACLFALLLSIKPIILTGYNGVDFQSIFGGLFFLMLFAFTLYASVKMVIDFKALTKPMRVHK